MPRKPPLMPVGFHKSLAKRPQELFFVQGKDLPPKAVSIQRGVKELTSEQPGPREMLVSTSLAFLCLLKLGQVLTTKTTAITYL